MAQSWTDDRLDDLSQRMDAGFKRVDDDVRGLRSDMNAGFKCVDDDIRELRSEMNARFDRMDAKFDAKFDALNRTLLQIGGGMAAAFGAALIGLIATQL